MSQKILRHCIVTPDFPGPIKNGGIGTACLNLARHLVSRGHHVTVLFTGPFERQDERHWASYFLEEFQFEFRCVPKRPVDAPAMIGLVDFGVISWQVSQVLESETFDFIHFQDWLANGFIPLQRRRTLNTLAGATITVTLHSSTQWQQEGSHILPSCTPEHHLLEYAERYAVEHADVAISPSRHMFDYVVQRGWKLPAQQRLLPYTMQTAPFTEVPVLTPNELMFFGRLETRKGLELFVQALEFMLRRHFDFSGIKLTFLGKYGRVASGSAEDYVDALRADSKFSEKFLEIEVLSDLDHFQCQKVLQTRTAALIVTPSLLDNYPLAVLECLQQGRRIIAANTGGIPEMIDDPTCLFDPVPTRLAEVLEQKLSTPSGATKSAYLPNEVGRLWDELIAEHLRPLSFDQTISAVSSVESPLVTICVPHHNDGNHFCELLDSLECQTDDRFTLIAVDDGSSSPDALRTFRECAGRYEKKRGWRFVEQINQGQGSARNHAAQLADTTLLMFMDADNIARPDMVATFLSAIQKTGLDCLSCYFEAFDTAEHLLAEDYLYLYTPIGPCIKAGITDNVFGDTNFIVKREVFQSLGGFSRARLASEDWEFLARLALGGYRMDVIPKALFAYRCRPGSVSRVSSEYLNSLQAIGPYQEQLSGWHKDLVLDVHSLSRQVRWFYHHHHEFQKREKKLKKKIADLEKKHAAAERKNQRLREAVDHWNNRSWLKRAFNRLILRP
ncbi:glycosyltransferase [Phragmitibacter flavus]|uniref:Glycosyltransferase n=1 Tax=Phragmitibacter flavus TaxID=2576071 RepID=A0A5R8KJM1_9BACT|nr:glycosyltransferase [Phragmitibacter flavus]TLD72516.1 glycosyltransferase [Phragmitibacter flavus]